MLIRKRKRAARIAWGIAALVLVFALVWFNFVKPDAEKAADGAAIAAEVEIPAVRPAALSDLEGIFASEWLVIDVLSDENHVGVPKLDKAEIIAEDGCFTVGPSLEEAFVRAASGFQPPRTSIRYSPFRKKATHRVYRPEAAMPMAEATAAPVTPIPAPQKWSCIPRNTTSLVG